MKKSIKTLLAFFALCGFVGSAYAFDFGGSLYETFKLKDSATQKDLKADWKNRLVVWEKYPFDNFGNSSIAIQASFEYEKDFGSSINDGNSMILDLDILRYDFSKELESGKISVSAGRFSNYDLTGLILSQNLDGAKLTLSLPALTVNANIGYTGLLNSLSAPILDENRYPFSKENAFLYALNENYIEAGANVILPYLFAGQTLSFEVMDAVRLSENAFNRLYVTLGLDGGIIDALFYNFTTTFGIASLADATAISNLSNLSLSYYIGNASVSFTGTYASGNNGFFKPFLGFTSQTSYNSYADNTEYSSIIKAGFSGTVKPIGNLLIMASADVVFDLEDSFGYRGFQYGLNVNYQLFSDVSFGLSANQYIDGQKSEFNKVSIEARASVSF